ncbi:hypothetical protein Glove_22g113 [Diversispora epigaea]|uniref:Uncharacterized protein n=1 Tax=Diversispora epigaea TaxID=1348612 RepID=A0A397JME7_9GLOM|nr:hypothetical protein Glove_22g113 [Diversispora epigaea]
MSTSNNNIYNNNNNNNNNHHHQNYVDDLPSPLLIPSDINYRKNNSNGELSDIHNHVNSLARDAIYSRLSKFRGLGARTITLSTELIAQFVKDYDRLSKDYSKLNEKIEIYEEQKSTLTPEKLEEFIKISDNVIKINEQTIKDLDQRHEFLEMTRKTLDQKFELDEMSKRTLEIQDEIIKGLEKRQESIQVARKETPDVNHEAMSEKSEKSISKSESSNYSARRRESDTSEKFTDQNEVKNSENNKNNEKKKFRSNEKEENFGIGSSRKNRINESNYNYETNESNAEISENKKTGKVKNSKYDWDSFLKGGNWDKGSEGNDSQNWGDEVNAQWDKDNSETVTNSIIHKNNEKDRKNEREVKKSKNDWDTLKKGNRSRVNDVRENNKNERWIKKDNNSKEKMNGWNYENNGEWDKKDDNMDYDCSA